MQAFDVTGHLGDDWLGCLWRKDATASGQRCVVQGLAVTVVLLCVTAPPDIHRLLHTPTPHLHPPGRWCGTCEMARRGEQTTAHLCTSHLRCSAWKWLSDSKVLSRLLSHLFPLYIDWDLNYPPSEGAGFAPLWCRLYPLVPIISSVNNLFSVY